MKKLTTLLSILVAAAASVYGAGMPMLSVTVSDASGHVAYKGRTNTGGTFASPKLQPGDYTVQLTSDSMPAGDYVLVVSAGKQKVSSDAVSSQKFAKGGVAMRVKVGDNMNVTGQLLNGKTVAAATGNAKVKIVNGKRWFWVIGSTGSNIGGHWIEEGTPEARNVQGLSRDAVNKMQDRGSGPLSGN